jgi:hypothetical protein
MGADRTLMQVKVRCGLGRVGVLGRLYGNSRGMSAPGSNPEILAASRSFPLCPRKRTLNPHRRRIKRPLRYCRSLIELLF